MTRNEYSNQINNKSTLDINKVLEYEDFIKRSKEYMPYTSPFTEEIVNDYDREMMFLNSLQETSNPQKEALLRNEKIVNIVSFKEQKEKKQNEAFERETHMKLRREKRAGYTNAAAIIFVVANLGLFLASLLLILK